MSSYVTPNTVSNPWKKHVNEAKKILLERQKEESMGPDDT